MNRTFAKGRDTNLGKVQRHYHRRHAAGGGASNQPGSNSKVRLSRLQVIGLLLGVGVFVAILIGLWIELAP